MNGNDRKSAHVFPSMSIVVVVSQTWLGVGHYYHRLPKVIYYTIVFVSVFKTQAAGRYGEYQQTFDDNTNDDDM